MAIFLAFQSQAWHTDEQTGHALSTDPGITAAAEPTHRLRIIAALVNPIGPAPELETVTLINPGADPVDLSGWTVLDRQERMMPLDPAVIAPGDTVRLPIRPPVQLGNRGGLLTLLDAGGLKVDGVAYTEADAGLEGHSVVFSEVENWNPAVRT